MRPLIKTKPSADQFQYAIHNVMMSVLGDYCSICERKLFDHILVWNKTSGQIVEGIVPQKQWNQLLLLCYNCADNYTRRPPVKDDTLLLPDEDITFRFTGKSAFEYKLKATVTRYTDETGKVISEEHSESVIASGTSAYAKNTVNAFALNTPYYNDKTAVFTIPAASYMALEDRRVIHRTQAWMNAVAVGKALKESAKNNTMQQALIVNARHQIISQGYWSTWMTALKKSGVNKELVMSILGMEKVVVKPMLKLGKKAAHPATGPGYHNPMPGTNSKWII